jgi:hypothetical protein
MVEEIKGEEDAALRLKTFFGEVEFFKQYAQMLPCFPTKSDSRKG